MDTRRPESLDAWMALAEVMASSRTAINRRLQDEVGLSLAENLVLCHVAMAPAGELRMADIAGTLSIAKSAVTKTVDRLEERGWVVRERDPDDRRAVRARLTEAGAEVFHRAAPIFGAAVSEQLEEPLNAQELGQFRFLLGKIRKSQRPATDV